MKDLDFDVNFIKVTRGVPPLILARKSKTERVKKWLKTPLYRPDLPFTHWNPVSYEIFNQPLSIPTWTQEEYDSHLTDEDWTQEETTYLFELVKEYNYRFYIVQDRYEFRPRQVIDLKDRFYSVCKKLVTAKGLDARNYQYDKTLDQTRRQQITKLYQRSEQEIQLEKFLYTEMMTRLCKEDELDGKYAAALYTFTDHEQLHKMAINLQPPDKKKRKFIREEPKKSIEKKPPGVYLRSFSLTPVKVNLQTKYSQVLEEFHVQGRPVMPTANIMAKLEDIRQSLLQLLELRRQLEKLETKFVYSK